MNTEQNFHIWLWSQAPGAREWDTYAEAYSPEQAVAQAEDLAGESIDGYPAIGEVCDGCPNCPDYDAWDQAREHGFTGDMPDWQSLSADSRRAWAAGEVSA